MAIDRKIVLENGTEFYGTAFGSMKEAINEIAFNTAMTGYQELISNLSCIDLMVVMTYPLIGNYGTTDEDFEAKVPMIGGLIVREYNDSPSNFRYTKTLSEILEENDIPAISGVDTRMLTRIIRDEGSMKVLITSPETPLEVALEKIKAYEIPKNAVERASCTKKWYSRTANPKYSVVAIDCGIKLGIIRTLNKYGCNVTVVPYNTSADEILALEPDGVIVSNGPGNPADVPGVIETINMLKGKKPIFGINLGVDVIALSYGAKINKMKLGHNGGNHLVKNLATGKFEATSQGHSFEIVPESLAGTGLEVTHTNLLDGSVEGIESLSDKVFGVQYHPESTPGPQDSLYIFDKFIEMLEYEVQSGKDSVKTCQNAKI